MLAQSLSRSNWLRRYSVDSRSADGAGIVAGVGLRLAELRAREASQAVTRQIRAHERRQFFWEEQASAEEVHAPDGVHVGRHTGKLGLRTDSGKVRAGNAQQRSSARDAAQRHVPEPPHEEFR